MNEADTRAELIEPALRAAGWGAVEGSLIRREVIAPGRLQGGGGRRSKALACDFVLTYRGRKLAAIEAKRRDLGDTEGVGQAKEYARRLGVRFAYSTNGLGIYRIDMQTAAEGRIDAYPTPDELWKATFREQNFWRDRFAEVPFEDKGGQWRARYYQHNAVEAVLEAIGAGEKRILLTLATGTGKTAIAFQIAWKLFQSRWNLSGKPSRRPRILFLTDRNILADQAYNAFSAFSAFADDALVRIDPDSIRRKGRAPGNGSVFFTIFQTFMTGEKGEENYGDYPPDFFDFIVIDECHRGGANDESAWRGIMEYFRPATQLGLTATPKRAANADTYGYFGEPVYVYSLREGIDDGYLTPFKVRRFATTIDNYTYVGDDAVVSGHVEVGDSFGESDFNRAIVIEEREAYRVGLLLDEIDRNEKTLVFCATQEHAAMIRDLINRRSGGGDPFHCVRVTADDGALGEQHLRAFQDNDKTVPAILTTSRKLSTGVDARNVRNIALLRPVNSMIEFKQIVGRGTRLHDGKDYFTIYDFVKAHERFNDPDWDGEPADPADPPARPDGDGRDGFDGFDETPPPPLDDDDEPPRRIEIKLADGKERTIRHIAATSFWGPDGRPMSAADFIEKLFGDLPELFRDEDELRELWRVPETRKRLLDELGERGYGEAQLAGIRKLIDAERSDLFDVLAYIAFALPPVTRRERVARRRDRILSDHDGKLRAFIDFVLAQYVKEGVGELDRAKLSPLLELKYGAVGEGAAQLGDADKIRAAFIGFQRHLY